MTVAFRRVELPLVVGLTLFLVGAGVGDTPWEDHDKLGWQAEQRGDYAAAELHFRAAMEVARALGERDLRLGRSATDLAGALYWQGRYSEAEPFAMQGLQIRESVLGEWHADVAQAVDAVALVHYARGRYAEAEALRKRSIVIFEKTCGKEHPDVATSVNSLASIYMTMGRYSEAEPLLRRAITIWEKTHGPDSLDCALGLSNLSLLFQALGRLAESEPLERRALEIRENALGPEHPLVAMNLKGLADLHYLRREYDLAEPIYRRALAIRRKALGPDHPFVATSLTDLGNIAYARARYAEAESIFRQVLPIEEKALGRSIRGWPVRWPASPTPTRAWEISRRPRGIIGEPWRSARRCSRPFLPTCPASWRTTRRSSATPAVPPRPRPWRPGSSRSVRRGDHVPPEALDDAPDVPFERRDLSALWTDEEFLGNFREWQAERRRAEAVVNPSMMPNAFGLQIANHRLNGPELCLERDTQRVADVASRLLGMEDEFTAGWLPLASSFVTRLSSDEAVQPRCGAWARRLFPLSANW